MARTKKKSFNKNYYRLGPCVIKLGRYKAKNVCLEEALINKVVVRVALKREHFRLKNKTNVQQSASQKKSKSRKLVPNGLKPLRRSHVVIDRKRYFLELQPSLTSVSRLAVNFDTLAQKVCSLKIPTSWIVSVEIENSAAIYTFAHPKSPSKKVIFKQRDPFYQIMMHGAPVRLLGCPPRLVTIRDIEILLEIVNRLKLSDIMICKV